MVHQRHALRGPDREHILENPVQLHTVVGRHPRSLSSMLAWIVLGAVFGAFAAWGAYIGVYDALSETRGTPARRLPRAFWRRSAIIAIAGALLGAVLMWRTISGTGTF